eukprot:5154669-Prymnesium_polylepis.1
MIKSSTASDAAPAYCWPAASYCPATQRFSIFSCSSARATAHSVELICDGISCRHSTTSLWESRSISRFSAVPDCGIFSTWAEKYVGARSDCSVSPALSRAVYQIGQSITIRCPFTIARTWLTCTTTSELTMRDAAAGGATCGATAAPGMTGVPAAACIDDPMLPPAPWPHATPLCVCCRLSPCVSPYSGDPSSDHDAAAPRGGRCAPVEPGVPSPMDGGSSAGGAAAAATCRNTRCKSSALHPSCAAKPCM